jgi:BirA family transcriptional regulator, biotin operon repressor / biotin---[acetyl-CoA-carboxylase] ligase
MFDLPRITKSGLVHHVDYHETLGSTSDRALDLATRGELPLPLLVLTERQTGGRGRGTNRWWSPPGALTFSLVLEATADTLPPETRSRVALVAGLAVCEALAPLVPRAEWRVKWPNDVFANGGKLCGILCESAPGHSDRLIVGIGINVNNRMENAAVTSAAGALVDLDGRTRDLTEVLLAVLDRFDFHWEELRTRGFAALAAVYRERCLLTGKTLTVTSGDERIVGLCRGIDDRGGLVLATESGQRSIVAGSIDAWE